MDKLVAQYSRQPDQNEFHFEQEQDLAEGLPPLSLKFSLPPVDNVSSLDSLPVLWIVGARWRGDRGYSFDIGAQVCQHKLYDNRSTPAE